MSHVRVSMAHEKTLIADYDGVLVFGHPGDSSPPLRPYETYVALPLASLELRHCILTTTESQPEVWVLQNQGGEQLLILQCP